MKLQYILIPIFAVIFLFYGISTIETDANIEVTLEEQNYTANNTPIATTNNPLNDYGVALYHFENTTFPFPADNWEYNETHITIITNGTNVCYPNITANCNYYATYSYQKASTVWGIDFSFIVILVIIAFGLLGMARYTGFLNYK